MLPTLTDLRAPAGVRSRSINAENRTGEPGAAAAASSPLGPGRKGSAYLPLPAGGRLTLADIEGPGVIRHIWITVPDRTDGGPFVLRDLVLRIYWDDEEEPSVESPLGDFFCNGFAARSLVMSEPIVVAPTGGMNSYIPMPFRRRARIVIDSDHSATIEHVFFQVDYTVGDDVPDATPYFHAQWRRSNASTALGEDHVIVDGVSGSGRYLGTYIGLASLSRFWWGEGEVKFFLDGDTELPTLCSTGLEDYAGGAWAFQDELRSSPEPQPIPFSAPYCGYPFFSTRDETRAAPFIQSVAPMHAVYRWHLPDPIFFENALRVTVQQIGVWDKGLFERSDDIFSVAYWYQTEPHSPFPAVPGANGRAPR
ncbi:glycoside hydrolase family 172 protein [Leifsonia poae]|uniref:glycoside hydrolase family 172 protein n=1 Tax=Leifsonia poae TaxID=110933 RepID=UPI001CBF4142|nr:glycoside hydrolase family 172 protein [Leifsonia poae]